MVEGRFKNGGFPSPIPISIIDHHKPGHPGYGLPPEKYMEASSLGQVLDVLDRGYTATDRLTAAADHCLGHAYQGKCPGVNPAELAAWRAKSRSKFLGIDLKAYLKMVEQAKTRIADLPVLSIHGARFLDSRNHQIRELPEASVQLGVPVLYSSAMKGGKYKEGILSATPEEIRAWKHWVSCREYYALTDIYGDPSRGYAGGYHYVKN